MQKMNFQSKRKNLEVILKFKKSSFPSFMAASVGNSKDIKPTADSCRSLQRLLGGLLEIDGKPIQIPNSKSKAS